MNIITREQWGAKKWSRRKPNRPQDMDGLIVHHSVTRSQDPYARVRAIQRFHLNDRGWSDIAYSFLISTDGTIFEGRGVGVQQAAHSPVNSKFYSVCFIGNFDNETVTDEMIDSFRHLRHYLMGKGVGSIVKAHRDVKATACPGKNVFRVLGDLRLPPVENVAAKPAQPATTRVVLDAIRRRAKAQTTELGSALVSIKDPTTKRFVESARVRSGEIERLAHREMGRFPE